MNGFEFIRIEYHMSLQKFADFLGVSKQMVYMWETGKRRISAVRLDQLEKLTGVPRCYFLLETLSEKQKLAVCECRLEKIKKDSICSEDIA